MPACCRSAAAWNLLGPWVGSLVVVVVVVVVQAILLADGGATALGYDVLNMDIVPGRRRQRRVTVTGSFV